MYTTLTQELQNDVPEGQNPCWAHFGLHDTRWVPCENSSFTEVKRQVMINDDILTKKTQKKTKNAHNKHAKQVAVFRVFFGFRAPQNRGSR